jgi:hypothetical protein
MHFMVSFFDYNYSNNNIESLGRLVPSNELCPSGSSTFLQRDEDTSCDVPEAQAVSSIFATHFCLMFAATLAYANFNTLLPFPFKGI